MCGDWNTVQDLDLDTYNILYDKHQQSRAVIQDLKNVLELIDPWRNSNQDLRMYTWKQKSPLKQIRLDYFLVSEDIHMDTVGARVLPGYKSHHSAIALECGFLNVFKGKRILEI
jgi:exonuclease III